MHIRIKFWSRSAQAGWNHVVGLKDHLEVAALIGLTTLGLLGVSIWQGPAWLSTALLATLFIVLVLDGAFLQWAILDSARSDPLNGEIESTISSLGVMSLTAEYFSSLLGLAAACEKAQQPWPETLARTAPDRAEVDTWVRQSSGWLMTNVGVTATPRFLRAVGLAGKAGADWRLRASAQLDAAGQILDELARELGGPDVPRYGSALRKGRSDSDRP